MQKYIVEYDGTTFFGKDRLILFTLLGQESCLTPYEEKGKDNTHVLELVKQGLTADDLVKLKNMGII